MPKYYYKAENTAGELCRGVTQASSPEHLETFLLVQGKRLLSYHRLPEWKLLENRPLSPAQTSAFCRSLGTLLEAGIPAVPALEILEKETGVSAVLKRSCRKIRGAVCSGQPLSEAMEHCGQVFPQQVIQSFRSAEHSGTLGKNALRMAEQYGREAQIRRAVHSCMIYPIFLAGLTVVVLGILMNFVIPQFAELFSHLDPMPLSTRILLAVSGVTQSFWREILLGILIAVLFLSLLGRLPSVRRRRDRRKLHLPWVGGLYRKLCTARFSRTYCVMYQSGIPVLTSLQAAGEAAGNRWISAQLERAIQKVQNGSSLSEALSRVDGFDRRLAICLRLGEESGRADELLQAVAKTLENEAETEVKEAVALLEPVMVVVMAVIIGFVVISVMLPLYQSYEQIGMGY